MSRDTVNAICDTFPGAELSGRQRMSRDTVNAICETFPGAELSDPWGGGHDAWKVGF